MDSIIKELNIFRWDLSNCADKCKRSQRAIEENAQTIQFSQVVAVSLNEIMAILRQHKSF